MREWIGGNSELIAWLFAVSLATLVATLVVVPLLIVRMPSDYFLHPKPPPESWRSQHPAVRLAALIGKNALGAVLLLAGLAMLFTPGQGVLTILIGLGLLNFPGKRELELRLIRQRPLLHAVNWMRVRAGRAPLELPDVMV